jgi:hypothetical protein
LTDAFKRFLILFKTMKFEIFSSMKKLNPFHTYSVIK